MGHNLLSQLMLSALVIFSANVSSAGYNTYPKTKKIPIGTGSADVDPYLVHNATEHRIKVLENGVAAFEKRMEMIEQAQQSIYLDYYIFETSNEHYVDLASRSILNALIAKARSMTKKIVPDPENKSKSMVMLINPETGREFPIHLLLDYYSWPGFPAVNVELAELLAKEGIHVRYFNVSSATFSPRSVNFRSHRKFFIVDNEVCIGGRNISVDYFAMWDDANYLDRDICAAGEISSTAAKNFHEFWSHKWTELPTEAVDAEKLKNAQGFLFPEGEELTTFESKRNWTRNIGKKILDETPEFVVDNAALISDRANYDLFSKSRASNFVVDQVYLKMRQSKYVTMENYSFIMYGDYKKAFENILETGVSVEILTNSLASDNATKTMKLSYDSQVEMLNEYGNLHIYAYSGELLDANEMANENPNARDALHAKTFIFDNETCIGTNNIDPRSDNLNLEAMLCVRDSTLTAWVKKQIDRRKQNAWLVLPQGGYLDAKHGKIISRDDAIRRIDPNFKNDFGDKVQDTFTKISTPFY